MGGGEESTKAEERTRPGRTVQGRARVSLPPENCDLPPRGPTWSLSHPWSFLPQTCVTLFPTLFPCPAQRVPPHTHPEVPQCSSEADAILRHASISPPAASREAATGMDAACTHPDLHLLNQSPTLCEIHTGQPQTGVHLVGPEPLRPGPCRDL